MERILEALANDDLSTMASTIKENPEYGESMKESAKLKISCMRRSIPRKAAC